MRLDLAERFGLIDEGENRLVWIVDWPLMEWNEGEKRWDALHHPFTAPAGEFDPDDPGAARAQAYDVVWNGQELGGGSIRIHGAELQRQVFAALGIDAERPRRASASCSRRCASAPRRTAASPTASTASSSA